MSIVRGLSLFIITLPALSHASSAFQVKPAAPMPAGTGPEVAEHGSPVLFAWADFDGDTRLDLAAVGPDGRLQLLTDAGGGRFEDVTELAGLREVADAALALWADYDGDGRPDLFVGASEGASRLFRNEGGAFVDTSAVSGLRVEGTIRSAHWFDHDGDGRLDLHAVTLEENRLWRGSEGGLFEALDLPPLAPPLAVASAVMVPRDTATDALPPSTEADEHEEGAGTTRNGGSILDGALPRAPTTPLTVDPSPLIGFPLSCASSIRDQSSPGSCLEASSTPTLGRLYPISSNLFVAVSGNVGIGTTSPTARLEVAGTARMTDTLTLDPAGDQALNVNMGSIYKGGVLFIHTKGDIGNNAFGRQALANVTNGSENTASGGRALFSNTTGFGNTANGYRALLSNTTGYFNTANGSLALHSNTTGHLNTACGHRALYHNTTGSYNTACGFYALYSNTTGVGNTASGNRTLYSNTIGFGNTASGAYALGSNTTGFRNTASGADALFSNTTGYRNTASGAYSLFSNTTGFGNTASGASALLSNTTGAYNTASGTDALRDNTTGNRNTASGHSALRSNTTGIRNTASGAYALLSNTNGNRNTASGDAALFSNTSGFENTASGAYALRYNTNGYRNTAGGKSALQFNTTGSNNTASGESALLSNTTGSNNTACGFSALVSNTTGFGNIALGQGAGGALTTGSQNIAIGNSGVAGESATIRIGTSVFQDRTFIAGIRGKTTGVANAIPVLIDSAGQLGTVSSSARFKEDIRDMGELTQRLLELRPVVFRYKPEVQQGERPLEYGLIAEEVAEVFPELVVYGDDGKPLTVKYHLLASMLLNELEKEVRAREELEQRVDGEGEQHGRDLSELRTRVLALEARLAPEDVASPTADGLHRP